MQFWTIFAAFLSANLLTVGFVWGLTTYSRMERDGNAHEARFPVYSAIFMPMLFGLGGLLIALNKVPAWLDFILQ